MTTSGEAQDQGANPGPGHDKTLGPSYLFLANQTLGGSALTSVIAERARIEQAAIHIVVPDTEPADEHPPTMSVAESRLCEAERRLRAVGVPVSGEVGPPDPMQAIGDALATHHDYSMLVISTLPARMSRWLHRDLPHRAARQFHLPVEWIESSTDAPDEPTISNIELPRQAKVGASVN
jgi:GABA permease